MWKGYQEYSARETRQTTGPGDQLTMLAMRASSSVAYAPASVPKHLAMHLSARRQLAGADRRLRVTLWLSQLVLLVVMGWRKV